MIAGRSSARGGGLRVAVLHRVVTGSVRRMAVDLDLDAACAPPTGTVHDSPRTLLVVGADAPVRPRRRWRRRSTHTIAPRADALALVVTQPADDRVDIVLVPRDVGVDTAVGYQRLGWALDYGGGAGLVAATAALTHIPIHHAVLVDFAGFVRVVNALGGVDVDVPEHVVDRRTGVELEAGRQRLGGRAALAWVRSRHNDVGEHHSRPLGDGVRRQRLQSIASGAWERGAGRLGRLRLARAVAIGRSHVVVDRALGDDAVELLSLVRNCTVRVTDLAAEPIAPTTALRSPFPPHHPTGSSYLRLTDHAVAQLRALAARASAG